MTIGRWDPFKNVAALQERINQMFDDTFPARGGCDENFSACAWKPGVDIYESEGGLKLLVDLPGLEKNNVAVELRETILTLRGERHFEDDVAEDRFIRRERCQGSFQRSFNLGVVVAPESIRARFKDGVLEITIPRPEEPQSKKINVDID